MTRSKLPSFLLTMWLLGTIATKSRVSDFLQSLQEYEIVYPRIIPSVNTRDRRSIPGEGDADLEESLFIEISNWTLKTTANDRLTLSSDFTVDWVHSSHARTTNDGKLGCNLRRGSLEGGDTRSVVVVTLCDEGMYVLMLTDRKSFFVQPLTDGQHVMYESRHAGWWSYREGSDVVSVMRENPSDDVRGPGFKKQDGKSKRKRRDSIDNTQDFYNLSGDVFDMEYPEAEQLILFDQRDGMSTEYNDTIVEELPIEVNTEDLDYFSGPTWQRNKIPRKKMIVKESSPRWLEIGIAADYSVVDFHGMRVQQYILALLNIVSAIYMDPSLESNMVLVIVRMILYAEKRDSMVRRGDARRSLENVNKWNRKMLSSANVNHDVAIWLTRLDIGGPSGYAPVSGVCDPARSCALNRDEGLTSAFIIAHEVAHILGLTHDGDESTGNACREEGSRGSVMAPMVAATFHHFYWSACSKKEFHRRVRRWSCLLNKPKRDSSTPLKATVRETFTMDEQCRMEFGEGYELCKSFDVVEPCSHLWCGNSNISQTCKTKKGPPLEGTLCGVSKWCTNGQCQSATKKNLDLGIVLNKPKDGGWSSWSAWEKCSRTCGIGVQCRTRKCNKPLPAYGGKYCSGTTDDCKLCDLPKCSAPIDLKAQQCSKLSNVRNLGQLQPKNDVTWLPYESDQENLKCQLVCRSKETGEIFYSRRNLIDGTPCSYGSSDICIQGECHKVGCDNVLGSTKVFDMCGVCDGDNSTCENVISKFQRKLRRDVTRVAIIPREARNLFMNITLLGVPFSHRENLTIVVGDGRRRRNVQENLASRKRDLTIVQGAAFRIQKRDDSNYSLRAYGTTFEDVVILLLVPRNIAEQGMSVAVSLQYFLNRDERNAKDRYVWLFGGWSFCSASCGGGTRQKMIVCKDEETGRIVSRRKCPLTTKPSQEIEKCNVFRCSFKWIIGPWEGCSATCGSFGIQLRQIYCVQSEFNGTNVNKHNELEVYRTMVQPSICKTSTMPVNNRECNRIPCPGRWIFTDWSACSKSNGKGIQSRIARCIPPDKESFYTCDGAVVKTEIRPCTGHSTRAIEFPYRCWRDKNRFCSIPSLKQYCSVPGFRRRCCRSCEINKHLDLPSTFDSKERNLRT
ncbi:A disintegrin and metalloproteinase with thrombospondin motifs 3-like isoform X1 [Hylaeus anthracinus]|uniref:A disintegrin and metalloproteinase with thrombospondin motifs 3-like isoform X1 n=1 Tax=Hylaeus anthracinus TaxID=313031 RepID=UPI0023B9AE60|nr:A disintegrin and metalloproteinase with thrombospondin motifs 3-like isoform X1 [Hylaeus anthracinus]XP_054016242.1 A disintegrin and metalloproteinase with thrombospondin motifs 3-like isoform X1 [Hylaeus anthracinus]XP_054016243.1 A disintegrin and metalloproteinase with thrombospondin motifs 3-like isoform X1 [Hylaeus anthracinus]XP_054016244.1 A disintegrin and metalloproteinase with thrombospondin motifs 3-like isoform X1 [Hylaeus anthracinus]XP_054016245.1 A disintegrin and metallopro